MQFNPDHKPSRSGLDLSTAALMDRAFYRRRPLGLNVQFDNLGKLDEWSFNSVEARENFITTLGRKGLSHAVSS